MTTQNVLTMHNDNDLRESGFSFERTADLGAALGAITSFYDAALSGVIDAVGNNIPPARNLLNAIDVAKGLATSSINNGGLNSAAVMETAFSAGLGLVGSLLGGPVGAAVGSFIGGYAGNFFHHAMNGTYSRSEISKLFPEFGNTFGRNLADMLGKAESGLQPIKDFFDNMGDYFGGGSGGLYQRRIILTVH